MIDPRAVEAAMIDSLYREEEVDRSLENPIPEDAVVVDGITATFGLHPERLETHRSEVLGWLEQLPPAFRRSDGGGWSFLQACEDRDGNLWGQHPDMQNLFVLAIGLGLAKWALPKAIWDAFPGGMPYVVVEL